MFASKVLSFAALAAAAAAAPTSNASPVEVEVFFASTQCQFTSGTENLSTTPGCHQFGGVVESFIIETPNPAYQLIAYGNQDCTGPSETYHLDESGCISYTASQYAQSYCIPQLGNCP